MSDSTNELAEHFPVGTPVLAWTGTRDDAPRWTKTRSEPWQLGHGDWVVAVEGIAGGIGMSHIERIPDGWVSAAQLADPWFLEGNAAATAWKTRHDDQEAALAGALEDIRERRQNFRRLNADPQYLSALDDAFGLVKNRISALTPAAPAADLAGSHDLEVSAR